jgi:hypothetical protein
MIDTLVIIPDQHAHPEHHNNRADWLGQLLKDLKPDLVLNLGDCADMASLSSYDKGTRAFAGKSYKKDIDAHLDFQERMWAPLKKTKKRMPYRVVHEGNHEHRIERALDLSPELVGTIGFKDFLFEEYYDEVIRYRGGTPGIYKFENILSSHFFITGVSGRPLGGEHPAHSLISKNKISSIAAHSHLYDYCTQTNIDGQTYNGLVAGCYQDYINDWSGNVGELWRPGITVLRNVANGDFDVEFIKLDTLRKEYGTS